MTHTSAFPILPKAQWPDFDRRCWDDALNAQSTKSWLQELEELCVRGNVTQRKAASPSALRSTTVVNVEDAYGQYLAFLEPPIRASQKERQKRDRVFGYLKALAASERAGNTIAMRAKCLAVILQVLVPDDDWQFLSRIVAISKTTGDPALKSGRIVDTLVLQDLGRRLVSEAESAVLDGQVSLTAALDHRDGLVIWLLAVRPMRRRNLTDLEIGSTICLERDRYWVHIPGSAVKTGRPLDFPVPDTLTQVVDRHLDMFRPRLLAERFPATGTRRLWIAATGTPLTDMGVFQAIAKRTKIGLGVSIPPHFFRDCAASSLYRASPENALAIAGVLGHSNLQTSKLHYVHGAQIAATVQLHSVIEELRATDRAPPKLFRKTQEHLFGPAVTDREDLV